MKKDLVFREQPKYGHSSTYLLNSLILSLISFS